MIGLVLTDRCSRRWDRAVRLGWQTTGREAELPHEASTVAPDGPVEEELNWSEQDPAPAASDSQEEWEHLARIDMTGGPPTSEPAVPEREEGPGEGALDVCRLCEEEIAVGDVLPVAPDRMICLGCALAISSLMAQRYR